MGTLGCGFGVGCSGLSSAFSCFFGVFLSDFGLFSLDFRGGFWGFFFWGRCFLERFDEEGGGGHGGEGEGGEPVVGREGDG